MAEADPVAILKEIADIPTAPFKEHLVQQHLFLDMAQQHDNNWPTQLSRTKHGIDALYVPQDYRSDMPLLVLTAHTDHPGFDDVKPIGDGTYSARVLGGLNEKLLVGAELFFHRHLVPRQAGLGTGYIEELLPKEPDFPDNMRVRIKPDQGSLERATFGTLGFWGLNDWPADRLNGPVMDDYAGVAGVLAAFQRIMKDKISCPTRVILYRGEEEGFLGLHGHLDQFPLGELAIALSIENSHYKTKPTPESTEIVPVVSLGGGAVIRTGDSRTPEYDATALRLLRSAANNVSSPHKFQEARMCGGVCDASLMYARGINAAGVCLPLKHYHNNGEPEGENRFMPEEISQSDLRGLTELLVSSAEYLAGNPNEFIEMTRPQPTEEHKAMLGRIQMRYDRFSPLFNC